LAKIELLLPRHLLQKLYIILVISWSEVFASNEKHLTKIEKILNLSLRATIEESTPPKAALRVARSTSESVKSPPKNHAKHLIS